MRRGERERETAPRVFAALCCGRGGRQSIHKRAPRERRSHGTHGAQLATATAMRALHSSRRRPFGRLHLHHVVAYTHHPSPSSSSKTTHRLPPAPPRPPPPPSACPARASLPPTHPPSTHPSSSIDSSPALHHERPLTSSIILLHRPHFPINPPPSSPGAALASRYSPQKPKVRRPRADTHAASHTQPR